MFPPLTLVHSRFSVILVISRPYGIITSLHLSSYVLPRFVWHYRIPPDIDVGQWLASGLQRPSTVRQSLAVRQKELSEEHRITLKRQKCIENKQNILNFFFFTQFFLSSIFFFIFFIYFFLFFFCFFFSIFLSPTVRQRWTVRQNGPSIEGPEGPPPTSMPPVTEYRIPALPKTGYRIPWNIFCAGSQNDVDSGKLEDLLILLLKI